jgi:hypothetical protein
MSLESSRWLRLGAISCCGYLGGAAIQVLLHLPDGTLGGTSMAIIATCLCITILFYAACWWMISRCGQDRRRLSVVLSAVSRAAFILSAIVVGIGTIYGLAITWKSPRMLSLIFHVTNGVAAVTGFAWLSQVAQRMRRPFLRYGCIVLSILSLDQIRAALSIFGPWHGLETALVLADTPLLGSAAAILDADRFFSLPVVPPIIWIFATTATVFHFGVLFLRLSAEAGRRGDR